MGKSVAKNYIYNLIYQIFIVIVPLITTPYVARVLGEDASGQYSFANSILTYFTLFAALGFGYYAQRLIASHQGDKEQQTKDFWEIIIARLIPVGFTTCIYFVLMGTGIYGIKYQLLMWILYINVFSIALDISFFFQGIEEFGKIVTRNVVIKILGIIAIFVFVKEEKDLWIYALIHGASTLFGNLSLWLYLPKYLVKINPKELKSLKHLPATFVLFLPTIAISIYTSLDKTLIGLITHSDAENGNYEYAERIVKMVMTLVTSLGTVLIPRNSQKFAEGDYKGVEDNINKSMNFVFLLGIPLMFGLIAVANSFCSWFLGGEYSKAPGIMMLLAPLIIIIGLSNVFGLQYLIPSKNDIKFTISVISGAIINLLLNIVMIKLWASYGAAIASLIAESIVTFVMFMFIRKKVSLKKALKNIWKYVLAGVIMFVPCFILGTILPKTIWATLIVVIVGIVVYFSMLLIEKEEFLKEIINSLKNKVLSKKKHVGEDDEKDLHIV